MFRFRLALALGRTVGELRDLLDSRELSEWMAFYGAQPFGDVRGDIQAAIIALTVASAAPVSKPTKRLELKDFMPFMDPEKPKSEAELEKMIRLMVKQHNEALGVQP